MNHKLHNTIAAFSVAGLAAVLMLLVAAPLPPSPAQPAHPVADGCQGGSPAGAAMLVDRGEARPAAALPDVNHDDDQAVAPRRARLRSQALAMPYFSFAHGLRRVGS